MIPEIVSAAADVAVALENGVAMKPWRNKPPDPPPPPSAVASGGISGTDFLIGMMIIALALLSAAVIVRQGLVA